MHSGMQYFTVYSFIVSACVICEFVLLWNIVLQDFMRNLCMYKYVGMLWSMMWFCQSKNSLHAVWCWCSIPACRGGKMKKE